MRTLFYEFVDDNGVRKRIALNSFISLNRRPTPDDKEKIDIAIAQVKDMELEAFNKNTRIVKRKRDKLFLIPFIEEYIERRTDLRKSSAKKYKHLVNHLSTFFGSSVDLISLKQKDAEDFKYYLMSNLAKSSADQYFSAFKTIVKETKKDKLIDEDITQFVKGIPQTTKLPTYLNDEELSVLKDTECSHQDTKNAFIFSCYTGLRYSDSYKLKYENIVFEDNHWKIKLTQLKTNSYLYIALNDNALQLIKPFGKPKDNVFNLWKDDHTRNIIKRWTRKAGLTKNITFHVARHTFATRLVTKRAGIYTVQKLLGHTDIKHTQKYAHFEDKVLVDAVKLLE